MNILSELRDFIVLLKIELKLNNVFIFDCSNGYVLSSTAENSDFDIDALGSLSSGSITAMEQLFKMFDSDKISFQIVESESEKFIFFRIDGNYFFLLAAGKNVQLGFLKLKIEKIIPKLKDFIARFNEENKIDVSEVDIDELNKELDSHFDALFGED